MWLYRSRYTRKSLARSSGLLSKAQQNCSRNWRIYKYHSAEARDKDVDERIAMKPLVLAGDESVHEEHYVGVEPWCYNCSQMGHLGDVSTTGVHEMDKRLIRT